MQLTESQTAILIGLLNGPQNVPAVHVGKLRPAGLVEATGDSSGRRGYANVRITDAGRAAIA